MSQDQMERRNHLIAGLRNKLGRQRASAAVTAGHILDLEILNASETEALRQLDIEDSKESAGKPSAKK